MRRLLVATAAVVSVGLLGTVVVRRRTHTSPVMVPTVTLPTPPTASTDRSVFWIMPADVEAARAVALRVVASTGEVVAAGFTKRIDLIDSFAAPGLAAELTARTNQAIEAMFLDLRVGDTAGFTVKEQPVTSSAEVVDGRVRVTVWSVMFIGTAGVEPVRQYWRTTRLEMIWLVDRWQVDEWSDRPGPTPALLPKTSIAAGAAGLVPLGWQSVTAGVSG